LNDFYLVGNINKHFLIEDLHIIPCLQLFLKKVFSFSHFFFFATVSLFTINDYIKGILQDLALAL